MNPLVNGLARERRDELIREAEHERLVREVVLQARERRREERPHTSRRGFSLLSLSGR